MEVLEDQKSTKENRSRFSYKEAVVFLVSRTFENHLININIDESSSIRDFRDTSLDPAAIQTFRLSEYLSINVRSCNQVTQRMPQS